MWGCKSSQENNLVHSSISIVATNVGIKLRFSKLPQMWQVANQRGYTCQGTWIWKAIWEVDVIVPIVDIRAFNEDKWHLFSKLKRKKKEKRKRKSDIKEVTNNIKHNNNCHLV